MNRYIIRRALWGLLLTGSMAIAGSPEHLGFTLNINSHDDVVKKLKARNATFNDRYGYRGYSKELPVVQVTSDPLMNAQGKVDKAWLEFTPDNKLYRISVTWRDSGDTFVVIRDVFESKYQKTQTTGRGFVKNHIYQSGDTKITLSRNSFGFGNDQKTSVEYLYLPAVLDNDIKAKNIKKKGVNL